MGRSSGSYFVRAALLLLVFLLCAKPVAAASHATPPGPIGPGLRATGPQVGKAAVVEPGALPSPKKVVGGQLAPQFGNVGFLSNSGGFFCSGVLIERNLVLTAAHCSVAGPKTFALAPSVGDPSSRSASYPVRLAVHHSRYNPRSRDGSWDIAFLLLDRAVARAGVAPAIVLGGAPPNDCEYVAVGFGRSRAGDPASVGDRRFARLCRRNVDGNDVYFGWKTGTTCFGDSGGPVFRLERGARLVAGITSRTVSCRSGGYCCDQMIAVRSDAKSQLAPFVRFARDAARAFCGKGVAVACGDGATYCGPHSTCQREPNGEWGCACTGGFRSSTCDGRPWALVPGQGDAFSTQCLAYGPRR